MKPRWLVAAAVSIAALCWQNSQANAHITVKSQYTFHRDVRPILQRRCGQCHTETGVAPTTLHSHEEVRAQSMSIRQALMSGRMPPWSGESGLMALQEQQALTARELDVLMTWAAGGTPEGAPEAALAAAPSALPAADAVLAMPAPFVLGSGVPQADHEVLLPSSGLAGKWIRAATVLPDAAQIVRRAEVVIRSRAGEQLVALWLPGDTPQMLAGNGAFRFPAGGRLLLRLHYQHPRATGWRDVPDRSRVGLYFAPAPAKPVQTMAIGSGRQVLSRARQIVGVRALAAPAGAVVTVTAHSPGGTPATLVRFTYRPDWPRRYVFVAPVSLPRDTRIDVSVIPAPAVIWQPLQVPTASPALPKVSFRGVLETVE